EVESVAGRDSKAVEVRPFDELGIDSALKDEVFEKATNFIIDESGEDTGALTEAAAKATGDVVFSAAFPGLELAGGANAAVTRIETEHDFTH
ncbi:MAG: hypothetical protein ACJAT6_000548, partial [Akkermansiaceae bacterium]